MSDLPPTKVVRTYGRPKPDVSAPVFDESGPSVLISTKTKATLDTTHSDVATSDDEGSHAGTNDALPMLDFGWKARMKDFDDMEDAEESSALVTPTLKFGNASAALQAPTLPEIDEAIPTQPNSPIFRANSTTNALGESLSTIRSVSASPPPAVPKRRQGPVAKRRPTMVDSDEESDNGSRGTSPLAPTADSSASKPRRSSTPPTSGDEDLPANITLQPRSSKGKGKQISSSRGQVHPLRFTEIPESTLKQRASGPKVKAVSKKEIQDTARDRSRIAGMRQAALQTSMPGTNKTLRQFFQTLHKPPLGTTMSMDDPITAFSSSPNVTRVAATPVRPEADEEAMLPPAPSPTRSAIDPMPVLDEDDEDLPEVSTIHAHLKQKQAHEQHQRELMERKLQLAALAQKRAAVDVSDDDDELEIVPNGRLDGNVRQHSDNRHRQSIGVRQQLALSGITPSVQRAHQHKSQPQSFAAAKTEAELNALLKARVTENNRQETTRKEEEWQRRGGQVAPVVGADGDSSMRGAIQAIAEKGQRNAEARMHLDREDLSDDASDEDWTEDRPESSFMEDPDTTMVDDDDEDDSENDENENEENENDENDENSPMLNRVMTRRPQPILSDSEDEENEDKENMDDLNEDKENMVAINEDKENVVLSITRRPLGDRPGPLSRHSSLFGLEEGMQRSLSMSPSQHERVDTDVEEDDDALMSRRRPLSMGLSVGALDFTAQLQRSSQRESDPGNSQLSPQPSFRPLGIAKTAAFSQFSDDEDALRPGFSDIFDDGTQGKRSLKVRDLSELSGADLLIDLTQDVKLNGDLVRNVDEQFRRQAGDIFEKEQEYLVEAVHKKQGPEEKELYINAHGFLTQTKPDDEAELYRPSSADPLPPQPSVSMTQLRRPLSTLSLVEPSQFDSPPGPSPRRRLLRRTRTRTPSPSPAPVSPIAKVKAARKPRKPLEKSEFVFEEAQESDEDEMAAAFGFGRKSDDPEEDENNEDLDQTLETLVDDGEVKVSENLVMEKYQEQIHEDDLEIEKLHQAAVQGELRKKKRRNRLGVDDSDSEDEDDDLRARKMRRGLGNEPVIVRGDVTELANNPQTNAFAQVYKNDLIFGDDADLAYLQNAVPDSDVAMTLDEEEEDSRETVSRSEIVQRIRELKDNEDLHDAPEMDVEDVSWIDHDSDEDQPRVKVVAKREGHHAMSDHKSQQDLRMQQWARSEKRAGNAGTGHVSGRTTVIGQRTKAGGGSVRGSAAQAAVAAAQERRKPKGSGILKQVAVERSARFD
ncbi:unnamed protein product [Mycena citricolor]|uniref:DNA replication checkpoint mediator MRC1 domain-containing protein n=1 Tax=Mycena citricolor TaxID=2018698 RepID=A0AAD2JVC9_9AGAR|nr:unnamed protein product [Mycena citricolor]